MADSIPQNGLTNVDRLFLIRKLSRVYSNDYQLVCVLRFEAPEVRNDVHAIDAAICPEIEYHYLSAKVSDRYRSRGVEPIESWWKVGCVDLTLEAVSLSHGSPFHSCNQEARRHDN